MTPMYLPLFTRGSKVENDAAQHFYNFPDREDETRNYLKKNGITPPRTESLINKVKSMLIQEEYIREKK